MRDYATQATQWIYGGIWSALVEWFKVPKEPPALPIAAPGEVRSFRPSQGFLRYLKLWFWLALLAIDVVIIGAWAYIAIHLRYDSTWYVMSDRSLRIRRGIWTINEMTITFENVQNVRVEQGPVQRYYGIADVLIDTAGAAAAGAGKHQATATGNQAVIEGIDNATEIRDQILQRLRKSKTAGLGDEDDRHVSGGKQWSPAHLAVLRQIRDSVIALRAP
jgi:membrane protein YdbS with pleckstrin-like domain